MNAPSGRRSLLVRAVLKCRSPADLELGADLRIIFVGRAVV
jgi:hypothetical protein